MTIIEEAENLFSQGKELTVDRGAFQSLKNELQNSLYKFVPPGHFYSPIPDEEDIARIFGTPRVAEKELAGIDMNHDLQEAMLRRFFEVTDSLPFSALKQPGLRYYYQNDAYCYGDAITLFSMMRTFKPRRMIEVGSGHSSCVMLDTNELFFGNRIDMTFIEPYPAYFHSLIKEEDITRNKILPDKLQEVPLSIFRELQENDILFIDSSHVSKFNSDVNRAIFEILPSLNKGVLVHFHDIFYPFEYPDSWIQGGRSWNEIYFLRAFLQFNSQFEIIFMSTYAAEFFRPAIQENIPSFLLNPGGNLWIRRK